MKSEELCLDVRARALRAAARAHYACAHVNDIAPDPRNPMWTSGDPYSAAGPTVHKGCVHRGCPTAPLAIPGYAPGYSTNMLFPKSDHPKSDHPKSEHLILEHLKMVTPKIPGLVRTPQVQYVYIRVSTFKSLSVFKGSAQDRVFRGPHLGVLISPTSCCNISTNLFIIITQSDHPKSEHLILEHPQMSTPKYRVCTGVHKYSMCI